VRQARGRHVEALQDFFTALQMAYDRTQYEVILGDLAACAAEAGYRATARNAHAALAKSAHAPLVRSAALVNLLELTVLDDDREGFAQVQRDIAEFVTTYNGMPADHAVHSALYQAYGAERFESRAAAIAAYQNAATQARTAGIHQVEFLAEQRLAALNASSEPLGAPIVAAPAQNLPESLHDIGKAIQELTLAEPQPMELYAKP
jgi:hypothetical protein